jgi:hypothetical protein
MHGWSKYSQGIHSQRVVWHPYWIIYPTFVFLELNKCLESLCSIPVPSLSHVLKCDYASTGYWTSFMRSFRELDLTVKGGPLVAVAKWSRGMVSIWSADTMAGCGSTPLCVTHGTILMNSLAYYAAREVDSFLLTIALITYDHSMAHCLSHRHRRWFCQKDRFQISHLLCTWLLFFSRGLLRLIQAYCTW